MEYLYLRDDLAGDDLAHVGAAHQQPQRRAKIMLACLDFATQTDADEFTLHVCSCMHMRPTGISAKDVRKVPLQFNCNTHRAAAVAYLSLSVGGVPGSWHDAKLFRTHGTMVIHSVMQFCEFREFCVQSPSVKNAAVTGDNIRAVEDELNVIHQSLGQAGDSLPRPRGSRE